MAAPDSLDDFRTLAVPGRLNFLEESFPAALSGLSEKQINDFLGGIAGNSLENNYVRRKAMNLVVGLVVTGSLKVRHALNLLIDDWQDNTDVFLEIQRLKNLYLFYDQEQDSIDAIFKSRLSSGEIELVSESYFHLGLADMQKGFMSDDIDQSRAHLSTSLTEFYRAYELIENRSDAIIFCKVLEIVLDVLNGVTGPVQAALKELGQMLFQREAFSFKLSTAPLYVGFYRILHSLSLITVEDPGAWLDFRQGMSGLFYQYSVIKDEEVKDRLNVSVLSKAVINKLEKQVLQPFFSLNFSAEKSKINVLLSEFPVESPQAKFLYYLRDIASGTDGKKKAGSEILLQQLQNLFPAVSRPVLDGMIEEYDDPRLYFRFLKAFESLAGPSSDQLTDKIISASLTLQSNRIYYGDYSEDDRNTFIASMLQAGGFHCKDQTRRSKSPSGKSAGEIDILIEDGQHNPVCIIEALNLTYINSAYIQLHLDKIFTYDPNGLKNNYILIYANAKDFGTFYNSYKTFVSNYSFQYPSTKLEEQVHLPYADLKKFTTLHNRNNMPIILHHLVINLNF
jgi:hypothetical protein